MLSREDIEREVAAVPHWHHAIDFPHGVRSPGAYQPRALFDMLEIGDLRGKRVLDVGTRDGFFAFECERLGAEVVAIDNCPCEATGFAAARRILGSAVEYQLANVYDLTPERFGYFDVVLFLGVLYHLRHPLLALDRLRAVCRDTIHVESLVCDDSVFLEQGRSEPLAALAPRLVDLPIAQFLSYGRFHEDWTNKWSPNVACLEALLEDALFEPQRRRTWPGRALVRATVTSREELRFRAAQDRGIG